MSQIGKMLDELYELVKTRKVDPEEGSYTNYLLDKGVDKICKKIGEEATEVVIGAKNNDAKELTYETADLLYHLTVLLYNQGVTYDEIYEELKKRR